MDELELSWKYESGKPGIDGSPENPLARASRAMLKEGRPQKGLLMCFFQPNIESLLRWFGIFVLSDGERLIFFPGFSQRPSGMEIYKSQGRQRRMMNIDHISLDPGFCTRHFTNQRSTNHIKMTKTLNLGKNRYLWFTLSAVDAQVFRHVNKETKYQVAVPPTDSNRRKDLFIDSRDGVIFNTISPNIEAYNIYNYGFFYFYVIVGSPGFPSIKDSDFSFPYGSPYLSEELPNPLRNLHYRSHRLSFPNQIDIEVYVFWLPGGLTESAFFG